MEPVYSKVMVPLDGSELAECVLPHVKAVAASCRPGGIVLVRVVEPFPLPTATAFSMTAEMQQQLEKEHVSEARGYLRGVANKLRADGVAAIIKVLSGPAADTLAKFAAGNGVDLVVLATHGRSGVKRWVWGSVADRLLRSTCVPVLMVRAPGCYPGV